MKRREKEQYLTENGFEYERDCTHGAFWSDGVTRVLVARGEPGDPRASKNFLSEVRRALVRRTMTAPMNTEDPKPRRVMIDPPKEFHVKLGDAVRIVAKEKPVVTPITPAVESERKKVTPEMMNLRRQGHAPGRRDEIEFTVLELWEKDFSYNQIAEGLNQKGFKTVDGTPWKSSNVWYWVKRLGLSRAKDAIESNPPKQEPLKVVETPKPEEKKPSPPPEAPSVGRSLSVKETAFVMDVLRSPIDADRKVKMILGFLE